MLTKQYLFTRNVLPIFNIRIYIFSLMQCSHCTLACCVHKLLLNLTILSFPCSAKYQYKKVYTWIDESDCVSLSKTWPISTNCDLLVKVYKVTPVLPQLSLLCLDISSHLYFLLLCSFRFVKILISLPNIQKVFERDYAIFSIHGSATNILVAYPVSYQKTFYSTIKNSFLLALFLNPVILRNINFKINF